MLYKKLSLTLLWFLGIALYAQSQNIYFKFTNSTTAQYQLSNIRSITYSGNNMNLNMLSGAIVSIPMGSINNFNYRSINVSTAINNAATNSPANEVSIYPNPSNGTVNLLLNPLESGKVQVEFIAINGEILSNTYLEINAGESQTFVLNPTDNQGKYLAAGIYLCRVTTTQQTTTKKIILQ